MGVGDSKPPSEYEVAKGTFSPLEQRLIRKVFRVVCGDGSEAEASIASASSTSGQQDNAEGEDQAAVPVDLSLGFDSAQLQVIWSTVNTID